MRASPRPVEGPPRLRRSRDFPRNSTWEPEGPLVSRAWGRARPQRRPARGEALARPRLFGAGGAGACARARGELSEADAPGESEVPRPPPQEREVGLRGNKWGFTYTNVVRYKSSLRPNFLVVKNDLYILQRTPTFSEQVWLHEKDLEKSFVRGKRLQNSVPQARQRGCPVRPGREPRLSRGLPDVLG